MSCPIENAYGIDLLYLHNINLLKSSWLSSRLQLLMLIVKVWKLQSLIILSNFALFTNTLNTSLHCLKRQYFSHFIVTIF